MASRKRYCRIFSCDNSNGSLNKNIAVFQVPKKGSELRKRWEDALKNLFNMEILSEDRPFICSLHFDPKSIYYQQGDSGTEVKLKHGAVPNIGNNSNMEINSQRIHDQNIGNSFEYVDIERITSVPKTVRQYSARKPATLRKSSSVIADVEIKQETEDESVIYVDIEEITSVEKPVKQYSARKLATFGNTSNIADVEIRPDPDEPMYSIEDVTSVPESINQNASARKSVTLRNSVSSIADMEIKQETVDGQVIYVNIEEVTSVPKPVKQNSARKSVAFGNSSSSSEATVVNRESDQQLKYVDIEKIMSIPKLPVDTEMNDENEANFSQNVTLNAVENGKTTDKKTYSCCQCMRYDLKLQVQVEKNVNLRRKNKKLHDDIRRLKELLKFHTGRDFSTDTKSKKCTVCLETMPPAELQRHVCLDYTELTCEYCLRTFPTTIEFGDHLTKENHSETLHKCQQCSIGFPAEILLQIHQESIFTHPTEKNESSAIDEPQLELMEKAVEHNFECYICKITHWNKVFIKKHMKEHVAARDKKCSICKEMFTSNELNEHICHSNDKSITCDYCTESFGATLKLLEHLKGSHGEQTIHKCCECNRYFPTVSLRNLHEAFHKDRPIVCEICSKRFPNIYELKSHSIAHSDEKNFLCSKCGLGFKTAYNLRMHSFSHNEKTFKCEDCPLAFTRKKYLDHHREIHKKLPMQYKCNQCDKIYLNRNKWYEHRRTICNTKKKRVYNFQCTFCPVKLDCKYNLDAHIRKHTGEKPFQCEVCERSYAYKQDLVKHLAKEHNQTAIYTCDLCKKGFERHVELLRHCCEEYKKQLTNADLASMPKKNCYDSAISKSSGQ